MTEPVPPPALPAKEIFSRLAESGRLHLPVCLHCNTVQYPVSDICSCCLATDLEFKEIAGDGTLLTSTLLYRSNDHRFLSLLPLRIAAVKLDVGPVVIAHLPKTPDQDRVFVGLNRDQFGYAVLTANAPSIPRAGYSHQESEPHE